MTRVRYGGRVMDLEPGETVLDGLLRHGVPAPHSCRAGVCQSCLMRARSGAVPPEAQAGLKASQAAQGYFLPCVCHPVDELELEDPEAGALRHETEVLDRLALGPRVLRLRLRRPEGYAYRAGQFLNLHGPGGEVRSYSLASAPERDDFLELHVGRVEGGVVSGWIHEALAPGDPVTISDPAGDCFYLEGRPRQALLLVGTGTGLAPLYGILREALARGHEGPIWLYHGSRAAENLYLGDVLRRLAAEHPQFHYRPCVSGPQVPPGFAAGRADDLALAERGDLSDWRVFLCGHPAMVEQAKRRAFLAGAALADLHADPFLPSRP